MLPVLLIGACSFDPSNSLSEELGSDATLPTISESHDAGKVLDRSDASPRRKLDASPIQIEADATPMPVTCQSIYSKALSYELCEETPTSCRFAVQTNEDTCNNLCAMYGGACMDGYDSNCGGTIASEGCAAVHYDQVCICSKP